MVLPPVDVCMLLCVFMKERVREKSSSKSRADSDSLDRVKIKVFVLLFWGREGLMEHSTYIDLLIHNLKKKTAKLTLLKQDTAGITSTH